MLISLKDAQAISNKLLVSLDFTEENALLITRNLIAAELAEKKTHGLIRLLAIKKQLEAGALNVKANFTVVKETASSLYIDANRTPGFIVIYKSLDLAIPKAKENGIVAVGIKDLSYASGYIGSYAQIAAENGLVFIGFNNSPGGLVPHGTTKELWGTNPLTVGIPSKETPVLLDMASSKITWGQVLIAKQEGKTLPEGSAIDGEGNPTTDPEKALEGGLLPIAGHKGSGLGFIVELLGGALTGSRVGHDVPGEWGTFYILIDCGLFRSEELVKKDVSTAIRELKNAPLAAGVNEAFFPGEQAARKARENSKAKTITVSDKLWEQLLELAS